jgi:hypothetical protein
MRARRATSPRRRAAARSSPGDSSRPPRRGAWPLDPPIRDVDGDDLAWALAPLGTLAEALGYTVVIEALPAGVGGYCRPSSKTAALAEGKRANHRVHTHVHELAHALLAAEPDDLALDYAKEEPVVESITYAVAGALGLDVDGYAIPYLTSLSQDTDLAIIERAAATIDRLAKRIEDAIGLAPA